MQDIVFYAAANETLGQVRDYSNMRSAEAPLLTLGVAVCLKMRLFAAVEVPTPYPVASFSNIADWQWSMDADFDRSTACKLVADEGNISVQTVTDTVNGETMNFTEFVIPISNMNTEELSAWLGNEKMKSGLTGELVGYDSEGYASFVLQIENFKVRNRVSGLSDPTALDQEIITRSQAEQIIQTTVSSSLATKQDKLTAANGGTGISVTSGGIISVSNIPQSAVDGLTTAITNGASAYIHSSGVIPVSAVVDLSVISSTCAPLAEEGWTRYISAGAGVTVTTNSNDFPQRDVTIALKDYDDIVTLTGATVTVAPGKGYKLDATTGSKTIAIDSFDAGKWGRESHIELFVANTGYVHVGNNVTLVDPLEPDAVNNCTVRFHDGHAIISVEDHVEAYMVNNTSTSSSTAGTLAYGIKQTGDTYKFIGFRSELNNSVVPTGGATATVVKHFVGNGMDVGPTISGEIKLNSNGTFRDCKLNGLIVSGGTAILTNITIPNGGTVVASGGYIYPESVYGGGTIDFNGTAPVGETFHASGCTFQNGTGWRNVDLSCSATSCTFSGFNALSNTNGAVFYPTNRGNIVLSDCVFSGNSANIGGAIHFPYGGNAYIYGGLFTDNTAPGAATICCQSGTTATIDGAVVSSNSTPAAILAQNPGTHVYASNAVIVKNGIGTDDYDILAGISAVFDLLGGCTVGVGCCTAGGSITFAGSNTVTDKVTHRIGSSGYIVISSGASITLHDVISCSQIKVLDGGCVVNGTSLGSAGGSTTYTKIQSSGGSAVAS